MNDKTTKPIMTRPGLPFDHDLHTHISISDLSAGMETQADDQWTHFAPWSILTTQQAEDGRLFVNDRNGKPVFLDDLSAEQPGPEGHDFIWGLFYVPLGEAVKSYFGIVDGVLAMVDADGNLVPPHSMPEQVEH